MTIVGVAVGFAVAAVDAAAAISPMRSATPRETA